MADTPFRKIPYGLPALSKSGGDVSAAMSDLAKNTALAHNINVSLMQRVAGAFVITATDPLSMAVQAWPGAILVGGVTVEKQIQVSPTLVAPKTNPRIDRIDLDAVKGTLIYTEGTEASSSTPPDLPANAFPLALVQLTPGQQSIGQPQITDIRVFAGTTGAGTGTPTPPPPPPPPTVNPNSYYVSASGNDGNNGLSVASAFLTLEKAQTAMQGDTVRRNTYVCAGTYNRAGQTLTLSTADDGTTWSYYPPDGVNTAVLDGGITGYGQTQNNGVIYINGGNNITINGLKVQHFGNFGIAVQAPSGGDSNGNVITNCELGFGFSDGGSTAGAIAFMLPYVGNNTPGTSRVQNTVISNNYVHDVGRNAVASYGSPKADSYTGCVIENNVLLNTVQNLGDEGAIYLWTSNPTLSTPNSVLIKNNFIRDYGSPAEVGNLSGFGTDPQPHGVYLDNGMNGCTVTGNIIGPPTLGTLNSGNHHNVSCIMLNSDDSGVDNGGNNQITGNILDTGSTSFPFAVQGGGATHGNSQIQGNIVLFNFVGASNVENGGHTWGTFLGISQYTITTNLYHNYGGGAEDTTDTSGHNDSNPQHADPKLSTYLYTMDPTSPALVAPINFPAIVGVWGPPGFTIPTSTNHSPT